MARRALWQLWFALALLLSGYNESGAQGHAGEVPRSELGSLEPGDDDQAPSHDLRLGETVFKRHCLGCHGKGVYEAPRLGEAADWESRLREGLDTMIAHAIEGHGNMPPKGGFHALSNHEVAAAVAYVAEQSRKIILARRRQAVTSDCHPLRSPQTCSRLDAEQVLTLHMLWLLGARGQP